MWCGRGQGKGCVGWGRVSVGVGCGKVCVGVVR